MSEKLMEAKKAWRCRVCGTQKAMIAKYNLRVCRRCFKDIALKMGFRKYS